MAKEQQAELKMEDLHPALQMVYEIGAEVEAALTKLLTKEGEERVALNLTDGKENTNKVSHYEPVWNFWDRCWAEAPVYEYAHRWRVNFAMEGTDSLLCGLSLCLKGVSDEASGIRQLEIIANDLQKVYDLAYTPNIYRDGKPLQD